MNLGPIITWRLDLRSRWQLILEQAPKKHTPQEIQTLRGINKDLVPVTRDRNMIVHGIIHAVVIFDGPKPPPGTKIPHDHSYKYAQSPCWTVFRGAEAGKNFPVSAEAVKIVNANIQKIITKIETFNNAHAYHDVLPSSYDIETDWPKPLE